MKNLFLLLISLAGLVHSSHIEIKTMTELGSFVDADTLVIFDLDNTVFQAKRYDCHADWGYDHVRAERKLGPVSSERIQQIYLQWLKAQKTCPVEFVEVETGFEIDQLQKRNIKVMALTSRGSDSADDTLDQLRSLGVSFLPTALSMDFAEFDFNSKAKFLEGVLFVSIDSSKGDVLRAYFETIRYQPKKIVFIDDLVENLESIEASFPEIEFFGLHYPLVLNRRYFKEL